VENVLDGGISTFMPFIYSYIWVQPEGEGFVACPEQDFDHNDELLVKSLRKKGITRVIRDCKFDTSMLKVENDAVAKVELPGLKRKLDIVSLTQNDELCAVYALL